MKAWAAGKWKSGVDRSSTLGRLTSLGLLLTVIVTWLLVVLGAVGYVLRRGDPGPSAAAAGSAGVAYHRDRRAFGGRFKHDRIAAFSLPKRRKAPKTLTRLSPDILPESRYATELAMIAAQPGSGTTGGSDKACCSTRWRTPSSREIRPSLSGPRIRSPSTLLPSECSRSIVQTSIPPATVARDTKQIADSNPNT